MDADFWHDRWKRGAIGFHRPDANPALARHWRALRLEAKARVLVPLAGKSRDLDWLRHFGHTVMGVELSPIAVTSFFEESGWEPNKRQAGPFEIYESHGIEMWCGDFFDLPADAVEGVTGLYDRAALIALPEPTRQSYARRLDALLPERTRGLLVSLDYGPDRSEGPPFSVTDSEVRRLFGDAFEVELLERGAPEDAPGGLRSRGIEQVTELVFALRRG